MRAILAFIILALGSTSLIRPGVHKKSSLPAAYYSTTVTNGSLPGSNTTTTIASLTLPAGSYIIQFSADIAVAGESGLLRIDRCRIVAPSAGGVINSQQTIRVQDYGGDLAMVAAVTLPTSDTITVTVRNTSIVAATANTVNLVATQVSGVTIQ